MNTVLLQTIINLLILITMFKYVLAENALTLNPDGFVAVVSNSRTRNLDDVVDMMIAEGTGLTRPQAYAYFEKLIQIVEYYIEDGDRVVTPLFCVKPAISGVFNGPNDFFDPSRHSINIRTSSGLRLKELPSKIKLEKTDVMQPIPILRSYFDGINKTVNTTAVSDGYGTIRGTNLRFDLDDNRLGVFFIPVENPSEEIPMSGYLEILPSKLHFRIPVLSPGVYKVIVRTLSRNGLDELQGVLRYRIRVE